MRRIANGFDTFARVVVVVLSVCALFYLLVSLLLSRAVLELTPNERVRFVSGAGHIALTLVLLLLCILIDRPLRRVPEKTLYAVLVGTYLIIGMTLVVGAKGHSRADPELVLYGAHLINTGDYSWLAPGQYLDCYPHQLGLLTVERPLLYLFKGSVGRAAVVIQIINLSELLAVYTMVWRSAALLKPCAEQLRRWLLLAMFSFLPALFSILMPYGHLPGLFFYVLAVYLFLLGKKQEKKSWWVLSVLSAILSVWLRSGYLIGVMALAAVAFMQFVKEKRIKLLMYTVAVLLCASQVSGLTAAAYRSLNHVTGGGGIPFVAWIKMGLTRDGNSWGWHNGYHRRMYVNDAKNDPKAAYDIAMEGIKERFDQFRANPAEGWDFFHHKLRSGWCESTFGGVWAGPSMPKERRSMLLPFLTDLYAAGKVYTAHQMTSAAWLQLVYTFALVNLLWRKKQALSWLELLPYIYFLGGFLFHIFWEMKSLYLYTYVLALAFPAVQGAQRAYRAVMAKRQHP